MLWFIAGGALLGLTAGLSALAFFLPLSLSSNLQARAEPSGAWAVAGGVGLGPMALSVIAAKGVAPFLTCHLFCRQVLRVPLSRWSLRASADDGVPRAPPPSSTHVERSMARFFRGLDPVDALLSWWGKERFFEVRSMLVGLDYSFRDVAFTGRVLAAVCVMSAVLPDDWQLNQTPSWDSEDRVSLTADGRFRIWLGRLLFELARFVLQRKSRMRQNAVPASQ